MISSIRALPKPQIRLGLLLDFAIAFQFCYFAYTVVTHPIRYLYDDSLFYLQIAWSLAKNQSLTFSDSIATNGFHPFWLLICAALSFVTDSKEALAQAVSIAAVVIGLATILIMRLGARPFLNVDAISMGLLLGMPYFLWAGIGMESPLATLFLLSFLISSINLLERPKASTLYFTSLMSGLCLFSRLDLGVNRSATCSLDCIQDAFGMEDVGQHIHPTTPSSWKSVFCPWLFGLRLTQYTLVIRSQLVGCSRLVGQCLRDCLSQG